MELEISKLFFLKRKKYKEQPDIPSFNAIINGVGIRGFRILGGRITPPSISTDFTIAYLDEDKCKALYEKVQEAVKNFLKELDVDPNVTEEEKGMYRASVSLLDYEQCMLYAELDKKVRAKILG